MFCSDPFITPEDMLIWVPLYQQNVSVYFFLTILDVNNSDYNNSFLLHVLVIGLKNRWFVYLLQVSYLWGVKYFLSLRVAKK